MRAAGANLQDIAIAGAISRALTIINRHEQAHASSRRRTRHRVLVLQACRDGSSQYIPVMNTIFAAQKCEVRAKCCCAAAAADAGALRCALLQLLAAQCCEEVLRHRGIGTVRWLARAMVRC